MSLALVSLVAALAGCGGSSGPSGSPTPASGATVIDWFVGATNVQTTVKAGDIVQWRSTDGMAHTVTSNSAPSAFAEIGVSGGALSSPMTFDTPDRKSTRLNSSHLVISYAVFCLKKKKNNRL